MERKTKFAKLWIVSLLSLMIVGLMPPGQVAAQPFGKGLFDENVPFGNLTSLSISTSGNVSMGLTPSDSGVLATANNTVTVTSTDVVGYKLYIRALSSNDLSSGVDSIPASANGSPASLSVNTWGYNIDASSNYVGVTTSDVLIKNATGPYQSGDATTFTYGVKVNNAKSAGSYVTTILYTAVPQTD